MQEEWPSVTAEAHELVRGDRGRIYDHPAIDYGRTAAIFAAITGIELSVPEAVTFMLAVKLSRIGAALDHDFPASVVRDSIVDLAGYADCLFGVWDFETSARVDELLDELDDDLEQ